VTTDQATFVGELKKQVGDFCEERDWRQFHSPKDLAIGITTESAELLEIFRFQSDQQVADMLDRQDTRQEIGEELADVFFFLLRLSELYGFDLSSELKQKLEKNALRYSVATSRGKNYKQKRGKS
jgi:NTP pyrophosphatase (non-canonical NTP hydrolase)